MLVNFNLLMFCLLAFTYLFRNFLTLNFNRHLTSILNAAGIANGVKWRTGRREPAVGDRVGDRVGEGLVGRPPLPES